MAIRRIVRSDPSSTSRSASGRENTVDGAASRYIGKRRGEVRRSELLDAVRRLDASSDPAVADAIMAWIRDEYEQRQGGIPIGILSRCYLGAPYIDHRLDLLGTHIVEHYTPTDTPPGPFASARALVRSDSYLFVEVYDDGQVLPVRPDGSAIT